MYKRQIPYRSLDSSSTRYPLLRFPWREVRQSLLALTGVTAKAELVHLAYVNPETGRECLPTLGFSAIMLRPGEETRLRKRSASAVIHGVEGVGIATIDHVAHAFGEADTIAVPTHAEVMLSNASGKEAACLFMVDDAPLHRKLGIYEVFD